jgi:purine-cytosine permease-like protein
VPFVLIYVVLAWYASQHARVATGSSGVTWQLWTQGLAFTVALSGLGWTENGNDYSRYLRPDVSATKTVGWLFVATALPEIALMALGAAVSTFLGSSKLWGGPNPFEGLVHQQVLPGWFVVVFLCFVVVQLFGINSLDLYSSGVTLQALVPRIRRYHAVLIDSVICLALTFYAVFDSQFSTLLRDFVAIVIVWIAPWCGIFLTDWWLRQRRYDPAGLQRTGPLSPYWASAGVHWGALGAQLLGGVAALSALSSTFLPSWATPLYVATGSADFSVPLGLCVGALAYVVLGGATVRRQERALWAGA